MNEHILDEEDFMERVQGDKELFFELLDIFVSDFSSKRQSLEEAIAKNDKATIEHVAHFLKGSCGNISARPLGAIFSELEKKGKDDDLEGLEKYLGEIDQKFEELMTAIGALRTKLQ